ncbi:isochorismatase family protein [Aurantimonas sp. C2-6-R+9]|uniref:isochorismatase family protein n=1 Tax=unclassified Aurantimonas TaxID=2638230 RepID=UPI002E190C77|nr:isochorismatase family protein [Aurantimonas sp. C2-6-R+9]
MVVDLSLGFTDPASDLGTDCSDTIASVNLLLAAFRVAGGPIFFSTIAYDEPNAADAGVWTRKIQSLPLLAAGSKWVEQDPRLKREANDPIISKKQASCFFGTNFEHALRDQDIDTLVIAGVSTSGCVRATAVDAAQLGLRVIVAAEAVGDRLPEAHRQSLVDIDLKYGDVMGVGEIREHLRRKS